MCVCMLLVVLLLHIGCVAFACCSCAKKEHIIGCDIWSSLAMTHTLLTPRTSFTTCLASSVTVATCHHITLDATIHRVEIIATRLAVCSCEALGTFACRHVASSTLPSRIAGAVTCGSKASTMPMTRLENIAGLMAIMRVCILLARLAVCSREALGTLLRCCAVCLDRAQQSARKH